MIRDIVTLADTMERRANDAAPLSIAEMRAFGMALRRVATEALRMESTLDEFAENGRRDVRGTMRPTGDVVDMNRRNRYR